MSGTLFLIPSLLGDSPAGRSIPAFNSQVIHSISHFIVEDAKSARKFLRTAGYAQNFVSVNFYLLNEHTRPSGMADLLKPLEEEHDMGVLSDAGSPGIADPGAAVVRLAHERNIKVVPLVGPSSILLALMASGLNGQEFCFHGYLPKERNDRVSKLKELEKISGKTGQTQVFIEVPYRNDHLLEDILGTCSPSTLLCLACAITLASESIRTRTIAQWKKDVPRLDKRPVVFLIQKAD